MHATLDESQVVRPEAFQPPILGTGSPGTGTSVLRVNRSTGGFSFSLEINGIDPAIVENSVGPNATGIHVHIAPNDKRGPVAIDVHHLARQSLPDTNGLTVTETGFRLVVDGVYSRQQGDFESPFTLEQLVDGLLEGAVFVAVHTNTNSLFKTGAIRGNYPAVAATASQFLRGDGNGDGSVDASDAVFLMDFLFRHGLAATCGAAANVNNDGKFDIADPVYLLSALFRGGVEIPTPYPECGVGPAGAEEFGCEASGCSL